MPSNSVNLGWSFMVDPMAEPSSRHRSRTTCRSPISADEDVRAAYARQAAHDWHEFVAFRGASCVRGGRLVVLTMAVDETANSATARCSTVLFDALDELTARRLLTRDEVHRMCVPMVGRKKADFFAPFAPSGRFERLSIDHLEVFDAEDRFWSQYQVDDDATAFAALWAAFVRASMFPTIATALAGGRTDPRSRSSSTGWNPESPSDWRLTPNRCRSLWPSWC